MDGAPQHDDAISVLLVVDDYPENLVSMRALLQRDDWRVITAASGLEALELLLAHDVDLVLLDVRMPGMDGFEVARRLKADAVTAGIPIVFMTALTETEHVVAAFGAGGVDYVTKPLQPREVLARMAVHLQAARLQSQARNANARSTSEDVARTAAALERQGEARAARPGLI